MRKVYLVAGGTGGHINAALSLGEKLQDQFDVRYISGDRNLDYKLFRGKNVLNVKAKALRGGSSFTTLINILQNIYLTYYFLFFLSFKRPKFVIGAGGYVCGPPLLAAWILRINVYIVEQNSVMGLTNRLLSKIAKKVFTHFPNTKYLSNKEKEIVVGNPVRSEIQFEKNNVGDKINILVFGGSLGADQINSAVELMLEDLFPFQIEYLHQVGADNLKKPGKSNYKAVEYIDEMSDAYKWANIIVARAGASTLSELSVIQKPCILIPFPFATDNHQELNALKFKERSHFYVKVLNQNLKTLELARMIKESIVEIKEKNYFSAEYKPGTSAVDKIIKELD